MIWSDAVITNEGISLMKESIAGKRLFISGVSGGTGTVPAAALMTQTDLINARQTLSLVGLINTDNGKKVKIQITSIGLEQGYTLNQVGVWAHLEDEDEKLFAILQDSKGVDIPSAADIPEFLMEFYALIEYSQSANISVVIDGSAYVSSDTLEEAVNGHNSNPNAHSDIRQELSSLSDDLSTFGATVETINSNVTQLAQNKLDKSQIVISETEPEAAEGRIWIKI